MPKWSVWLGAAATAMLVVSVTVAALMRSPAYAQAVGTPAACNTCHVMQPEINAHMGSAHRDQTCFDCHAAPGFWERPVDQIRSAAAWVQATVTRTEPDVVHLFPRHRRVVAENCERCHTVEATGLTAGTHGSAAALPPNAAMVRVEQRLCIDCHWQAAHHPVQVIRGRKEVTAP